MRVLESEQDRNLVRIIVDIAHLYGMRVVAEGIEDAETLSRLCNIGCDVMQGNYVAKPMPAEKFERWVRAWAGFDAMERARQPSKSLSASPNS